MVGRHVDRPALRRGPAHPGPAARRHARRARCSLPDLGTYRVIVTAGRDQDLQVTGLPTDPVEETTDRLVLIEAIVFAVAVALIGAAIGGAGADHAAPARTGGRDRGPRRRPAAGQRHRVAARPRPARARRAARSPRSRRVQHHARGGRERADTSGTTARSACAASSPTPVTSCAPRSPSSAATPTTRGRWTTHIPDEVRHALERISAQSERMGHLVEDLLLLARLDSGRPLAHDDVDLTRIVLDGVADAKVAGARAPLAARAARRRGRVDRRRARPAPGRHQPALQRPRPHAGRHDGHHLAARRRRRRHADGLRRRARDPRRRGQPRVRTLRAR